MDAAIEASTMRKVYVRLLPFAMLSYILAYLDRINVSFAALHMRDDLHMSAGDFGFAALTMNKDLGLTAYVFGWVPASSSSAISCSRFRAT